MKKTTIILLAITLGLFYNSCSPEEDNLAEEWVCGTHNGKTLYTGPKGGCYYYNDNRNKVYVERSKCNC
ncbi:hypothetical protein ACQY1Q_15055 [Tenacibaculum sp. TC6]|uniref:hypothetical protein n=1 Tax=Tenacibaculum sp. TC6 TaxID=3423223 RepID=UPI003D35CB0E